MSTTMDRISYLGYQEIMQLTGLPKRTLLDRIAREGVQVYVDGRDKRRRVLSARDVARLTRVEPVEHIGPIREYDGSAA